MGTGHEFTSSFHGLQAGQARQAIPMLSIVLEYHHTPPQASVVEMRHTQASAKDELYLFIYIC